MATLVTGLFKTRSGAERAVESLVDYGFSRDDISLLMSDATRGREFSLQMATKAPEGVATGATVGGVLGAIAAGLVALGIVVVPGLALVARRDRLLRLLLDLAQGRRPVALPEG